MHPVAAHAQFSVENFRLPGGEVEHSSPTLADLNGDNIPEVLVGTKIQTPGRAVEQPPMLVVLRGNGSLLWARNVGAPVNSTPVVADIDSDGDPEVIVSTGGAVGDRNHHGSVSAYDHTGARLWSFYPEDDNGDGYADGGFGSPTACDVDGDGDLEIAFGSWNRNIYLLDHQGRSLWNNLPPGRSGEGFHNGDTIWSTAACADLNKDGSNEIIIGADISGGGILPDGTRTQNGGFLYIFDGSGGILVRRFLPETVYASPAVGDLDNDGLLDIVVGTGFYWWNVYGRTRQPYVYAFSSRSVFSGRPYADPAKLPDLPGWPRPTAYPGFSSPALADLDRDGDLEIIIGSGDPYSSRGYVYAWHHTGADVSGWPVRPVNGGGRNAHILSSPTAADIDGDGSLEVLFSMLWDVQIYNASGRFQELAHAHWNLWGSPAVGDTDNDGRIEIWIGGGNYFEDRNFGYLWKFEHQSGGYSGPRAWPMFHHDSRNSGLYPPKGVGQLTPGILLLLMSEE